jgi:DNA-binding MarR family transcriptional regulator
MTMSTENRTALHAAMFGHIRHFIAATILFNQKIADQAGLHLTDMQCINLLDLLGPVTPGKLAQCMGLTTGGVTVMLDRLEKTGLVKREANPLDRRSVLVRVNARKMAKIQELYQKIDEQFEAFLLETPDAELQAVANFFSRMSTLRREIQE